MWWAICTSDQKVGPLVFLYSQEMNMLKCGQILFFPSKNLFKFKWVNIECNIGFRSRIPWFITCVKHPVLIPTNALLNARHPFSPSPPPLTSPPATFSLFSIFKSLLGFASLSVFCLILFFLLFPYVHLFWFLNSTYEWKIWYLVFSDLFHLT